ncbi:acyltransferase family protein [Streptomyces paromomycinus]|uniref:Acyltransferase n=1 Tax=Streptomyces paromomycinus TaxID=92743 RepID=A0A401WG55_STREY|nr:acyltransferase [Streptomyces paromomycinus]GCD48332.1 acyltransferase [Streptomyces paromomycinus]
MPTSAAAPPSPPSSPPPSRRHGRPGPRATGRHITPLDGLRGLAVLGVLFFHAGHFDGGFLGVDLFFVLSGFLITGLLLKEAADRNGTVGLAAFWERRVRRLLPALTVMIVAVLLLVRAAGPPYLLGFALEDGPWAALQATNWHFISDQVGYWNDGDTRVFSHLWSIGVEWQFYVVWPVVVAVLARRRTTRRLVPLIAASGAVLSLVVMIALAHGPDTTRVYEGTDTRAFSLLLGALMATGPVRRLLSRTPGRLANCLCAALVCGLGAHWCLTGGPSDPFLFRGGLFLHALAAALLIALLAHTPAGPVGRLLGSRPLRELGAVSYSLYLWHWPIYLLLSEDVLGFGGWARTAVLLAVSLAAGWLSKVLVEDPARFKARWARGRTGAACLTAALAAVAGVCLLVPAPAPGADSVDLTQLTAASG